MNLNPSCQKRGKFDCLTLFLLIEPNSGSVGVVLKERSSYCGVLSRLYASARNWKRIFSVMRNIFEKFMSNCSKLGRRTRKSRTGVVCVVKGSRMINDGAVHPAATE